MRIYTLLAALAICAAPLSAQSAVRFDSSAAVGHLPRPVSMLALAPPSPLTLDGRVAINSGPLYLAPESLRADGGRGYSVAGGVVGFLVGAGAGGAFGCLANKDDYGVFCGGQDDTRVFLGAALGAAVGAALGAVIFRHR